MNLERRLRYGLFGSFLGLAALLFPGRTAAQAYGAKVHLGAVNTPGVEIHPSPSCDGMQLHFTKDFGGPAVLRKLFTSDLDIAVPEATNPRAYNAAISDPADTSVSESSLAEICGTNQAVYVKWCETTCPGLGLEGGPESSTLMLADSTDRNRQLSELEVGNTSGVNLTKEMSPSPFANGYKLGWLRFCREPLDCDEVGGVSGIWDAERPDLNFDTQYTNAQRRDEFDAFIDPTRIFGVAYSNDGLSILLAFPCEALADPSKCIGDIDHVLFRRPTQNDPFDVNAPYFLNQPDNPVDVNTTFIDGGGEFYFDRIFLHSWDSNDPNAQGEADLYVTETAESCATVPPELSPAGSPVKLLVERLSANQLKLSYEEVQVPGCTDRDNFYQGELLPGIPFATSANNCHLAPVADIIPGRSALVYSFTPGITPLEGYLVSKSTKAGEGAVHVDSSGNPFFPVDACGPLP